MLGALLLARHWQSLAMAVAIAVALTAVYRTGVAHERQARDLAALTATLAEAERQRDAAATALDELTRGAELDAIERQRLNARIDSYLDRLNALPADAACLDDGDDVDSLRR